jgi:RNA polymerase-binding transcription factor DksA
MSEYVDSVDLEVARLLANTEKGISELRNAIKGPVLTECESCGEDINPLRVEVMRKAGMRCTKCISCQSMQDSKQ